MKEPTRNSAPLPVGANPQDQKGNKSESVEPALKVHSARVILFDLNELLEGALGFSLIKDAGDISHNPVMGGVKLLPMTFLK